MKKDLFSSKLSENRSDLKPNPDGETSLWHLSGHQGCFCARIMGFLIYRKRVVFVKIGQKEIEFAILTD